MVASKSFKWSAALIAVAGGALVAGCGGSGSNASADAGGSGGSASAGATGGGGGANGSSGAATKLTGAGATFPFPLYSEWFSTYNKAKGVQINYQSIGSGAGIKQLTAQTVDFGASDAPVDDAGIAKMPSPIVHIPTAGGAVVLAYNLPGVTAKIKMTGADVANIFLGKITKWNDPALVKDNPGVALPNQTVTIAHRSDGSGTTNIFTNYLASVSPEWKTKPGAGKSVDWPVGLGGKGNDGVAGIVKQTPGAIGYVELAYAKKKEHPLTYALVQNKAGQYVEPSPASVTAAAEASAAALAADVRAPIANASAPGAYPIAGFTYILAYKKQKDAAKGAALKDFLKWAMTDGQKSAEGLLYAPLPAAVVAQNQKTIDSIS